MNDNIHPTIEDLTGYIEEPDASALKNTRQHLVTCKECRNKIMKLEELNHNITHILPRLLDASESASDSLKARLHSATHSAAMGRFLNDAQEQSNDKSAEGRPSGLKNMLMRFVDWQPPAWASISATAIVVLAITLVLPPVTFLSGKSHNSVIAYQDDPFVTFRLPGQQPPGIGFFNDASRSRDSFSSLTITLNSDQSLHIKWTPVKNAKNYQIRLFRIQDTDRQLIDKSDTDRPEIIFNNPGLETGKRYEWVITGKTTDNLTFETQGGFVVAGTRGK